MRVVDLSFPIRPHFRWTVRPELRSSHARGDIFQSATLTISCYAYTHVDAPVHFLPGDRHIAEMPVEHLTNLDQIGVLRCRFIALPLAIEGAGGSPVRAIALLD